MRTVARVNLAAIERNVRTLADGLAGGATLCAVVKADGYGHGAAGAARAALDGGATHLAVVTAAEASALRAAGVDGGTLLVLGPLDGPEVDEALDAGGEVVVWDDAGIAALEATGRPVGVHVKHDSGMGRLGAPDAAVVRDLCDRIAAHPRLRLAGLMTHFATADDRDDPFFDRQLERFAGLAADVRAAHPGVLVHAANSAATLRDPGCHFDLVRPGVAIYGLDPFGEDPGRHGLEPALAWTGRLASVKPCGPGESVGYGRRFVAERPTTIGTVSVGYGDGLRRGLTGRGEALVGGRRVPFAGTVSMDSAGLDLGADAPDAVGDAVVLLGRDGGERITAEDQARLLGTINYEVTCGVGPRVPREHHRDGAPVAA